MRFLFTVQPMLGHFHAMVPLARALQEHGHQVAFATGAGFGPVVRQAGFAHLAAGMGYGGSKDIFEALPEWDAIQARFPSSAGLQQVAGFVEGLAPKMADDLPAHVGAAQATSGPMSSGASNGGRGSWWGAARRNRT